MVELGVWTHEVELLMDDMRLAPISDSVVSEARARLLEAIEAEFALARGDRSAEAIRAQAETANAMVQAWRRAKARASAVQVDLSAPE